MTDGMRNGYGTYTNHKNGITYKGYWKDNKMNGRGTFTRQEYTYVGKFIMDKKTNGTCTFANG
jgi:hypothetical protein